MSNFIAWFTISLMAVMSMAGVPLYPSQDATVGLMIFPLNAIINPLVNTICTKQFVNPCKTYK
jgi:hypothetical protein